MKHTFLLNRIIIYIIITESKFPSGCCNVILRQRKFEMKYSKVVKYWLFTGLFLVFMQIVIGGITRLTGSGLSITEWDIVMGTFPPFGEEAWNVEFEKYKDTPQYSKINDGMTMGEFKFIYFWEYFHRLWARMMGFIFLIPFIFFLLKGMIDISLIKRLGVVIFFAALAAVFGWIMVASGLIERPWVNAYKLSIHLSIGICVFLSMVWTILESFYKDDWLGIRKGSSSWRRPILLLFILCCIQIFFGGMVSGMRAALAYPTWPDMNGDFIPSVLMDGSEWNWGNMVEYERSSFAPALVQTLHRFTAYGIIVVSGFLFYRLGKEVGFRVFGTWVKIFFALLTVQVLLGIFTLVYSKGTIPVGLGVMHQDVGVLLLGSLFVLLWQVSKATSTE